MLDLGKECQGALSIGITGHTPQHVLFPLYLFC